MASKNKDELVDDHDDELRMVMMPSGGAFSVYEREVGYFQDRVRRYLQDNHFTNVSDLQDVDRMIILELLSWRYSTWVSQQKDYWGDAVDEPGLNKSIKETSTELRQIKASLGIDKVHRDRQRGEDSVSAYLENLRTRAKEFGVMREGQLDKALELLNQLKALVTLHDNSDEVEQREMHCTTEDVLDWIRETLVPEYDQVDDYFRNHQQKLWIRKQ